MRLVLVAFVALGTGGAIDLLWRDGMKMHDGAAAIVGRATLTSRQALAGGIPAPSWLLGSAGDALWQLAFSLTVLAVWRDAAPSALSRVARASPALLGLGVELAQAPGWMPGRFDPLDVVAILGAALVAHACAGVASPP